MEAWARDWLNLTVYQYPLWLADLRSGRDRERGFERTIRFESFGIIDFEINFVRTKQEQLFIDCPTVQLIVERKEQVVSQYCCSEQVDCWICFSISKMSYSLNPYNGFFDPSSERGIKLMHKALEDFSSEYKGKIKLESESADFLVK